MVDFDIPTDEELHEMYEKHTVGDPEGMPFEKYKEGVLLMIETAKGMTEEEFYSKIGQAIEAYKKSQAGKE